MTEGHTLFNRFLPVIRTLPLGSLRESHLLTPSFELKRDERLTIYYAPFDFINPAARVVLVGITPGFTQMANAFERVRALVDSGMSPEEMLHEADRVGSFSGPMRKHLVRMLDGIQLHRYLGIGTCDELFGAHHSLVHTTSAVRYPVFKGMDYYSGRNPDVTKSPLLVEYLRGTLADELSHVRQDALIIPLGVCAEEAVRFLANAGRLDWSRCLRGFPHPSGGNGSREQTFRDNQDTMLTFVHEWFRGTDGE